MERKMTTFASNMVGDNIELLYDVVCKKFKKFKLFYRLVEELSEDIKSLKYEFSSDTSLNVSMTMDKGVNHDEIIKYLDEKIESSDLYTYNIVSEGNKIKISIEAE